MRFPPTLVSSLVVAMVVVNGSLAHAAPISKCNAAKKRCIGKYVAATLKCHAKAESHGAAVDNDCLARATAKVSGGGKGCFDKLDAKLPNDCAQVTNAAVQFADANDLLAAVVSALDPSYPTPTFSVCGAARKTCVGKKAAGLMACAAKANKTGTADPGCAPKVTDKFGGANGCDLKALANGNDCLGAATTADLETLVDDWEALAAFTLDYSGPACGNGVLDAGEFCDPGSPNRPEAACGSEFACVGCTCACPSTLHVRVDAASPATSLDLGWTGLGHRTPMVSDAEWTVAVGACAASERPCGTCNLSGPIANAGATELRNRRCSNDPAIQCTDDAPCLGGGGTCQYFFGSPHPLSTGGVAMCTINQFNGPIVGTVDIESAESASTVHLVARVYGGIGIDTPCPQCAGDATSNDDVQDGTCAGGARDGLACDANGTVPGRPDFGPVSLDCPPLALAQVATLPIDVSNATDPVARTITAASPNCTGDPGIKCLCDTCNNANQQPCMTNADCPTPPGPIGAICGGRRCFGGPNAGNTCSNNTQCPGGGICARPGEPTRSSACIDSVCLDSSPVDGEGQCVNGPLTTTCTAPHAQRYCSTDAECAPGTCEAANRTCFAMPANAVTAGGVEDAPQRDVASPTLASVFCLGPTGLSSSNNVLGLPGPGRAVWKATTTAHP